MELAPSTGVSLFIRLPGVRVCGADATKDGPERQCPGNPGEGINAELDQHWRPVQHADEGHGNDDVDRKADTEDDQGQHPSLPMGDFHHPAPRAGKTGRPGRVSHVTACLQDAWLQPMCRVRAESPAFGTWHAAQHMKVAADAAFAEGSAESTAWFEKWRHILHHHPDGAGKVIDVLRYLERKGVGARIIARELGYFRSNRHRMKTRRPADAGVIRSCSLDALKDAPYEDHTPGGDAYCCRAA